MDVKSEQKFKDIAVTDIDVAYPGDLQSYTLRDGVDDYHYDFKENTLTITFGIGGKITFYRDRAHWVAIRPRVLRVPAGEASEAV